MTAFFGVGENVTWIGLVIAALVAVGVLGWVMVGLADRWHPPDPKPRRSSLLASYEAMERERVAREGRRRAERYQERQERRGAA